MGRSADGRAATTRSGEAPSACRAAESAWTAWVGKRAASGRLPDPPVELECLDTNAPGRFGCQLDHVLISELAPDGRFCVAADVNIGLHGVRALTHHEPLVDGRAQPFDAVFDAVLEHAPQCPLSELLLVDHGD